MKRMRRLRKIPTVLVFLGFLWPWGRVAAVSVHLSGEDHEGSAADHVAELEHSFHGHGHTAGKPDHRHPWIGLDLAALKTTLLRMITAPAQTTLAAPSAVSPGVRLVTWGRTPVVHDHGPPGPAARRAILRI